MQPLWFQNHWVPRREDNNPKTIDQIHKEAQQDAQKSMMVEQFNMQQKQQGGGRKRWPPQGFGTPNQSDCGWLAIGNNRNANSMDSGRMRLTRVRKKSNE